MNEIRHNNGETTCLAVPKSVKIAFINKKARKAFLQVASSRSWPIQSLCNRKIERYGLQNRCTTQMIRKIAYELTLRHTWAIRKNRMPCKVII